MDTEYDCPPYARVTGDNNATVVDVRVSHDLGDRTLVVVILLAIIIGVCGWQIGQYRASTEMQSQYMRDVAVKLQINTNHTDEVAKDLAIMKEQENAKQR